MIFAGLVAGGCGSRMTCAQMPKQFIEIDGVPIIIRTLKSFLKVSEIDAVYIGIKPDWHEYTDQLLIKYNIDPQRVKIIDGGADRNATVMNIAEAITDDYGERYEDIFITHDAVRPFVSESIIKDSISSAAKHGACGTYLPAVDTIVRSHGATVEAVLNRSELYQAQTPQTFRLSELIECYNSLDADKRSALTDTCSVFTACGRDIHIVKGDILNFKITTNNDLLLAAAVAKQLK